MAEPYEIRIHTIYSSQQEQSVARGGGLRAVGVLTFFVGIAWLYVAWNPVWKWAQAKATIGEIVMATGAAGVTGAPTGEQGLSVLTQIISDQPKAEEKKTEAANAPRRVQGILFGAAVVWLILASGVAMWLMMAGAANLTGSAAARRFGRYLLPVCALVGAAVIWYVWKKYEWYESILPGWVRPGLFALTVLTACSAGAMANRHGRGALRGGAYLVVGSAVFSVAAIWSAVRWGHMPTEHVDVSLYAKVFGVQSAYGWLLFFGTFRRK